MIINRILKQRSLNKIIARFITVGTKTRKSYSFHTKNMAVIKKIKYGHISYLKTWDLNVKPINA